jgi:heavy metal translocating P-type ATPase
MEAPSSLPATLAPDERRRISVRLGTGLAGLGLLAIGTLLLRVAPDQWQVGELCRGIAALVIAVPTLVSGIRGIITGDTRRTTDQLVAIAVLAAASTGHFVTATLIPLFLEIGRLFEERSALGARAAIDGIRAFAARQAVKLHGDEELRVDPETLVVGDEIVVRPSERIAVDGTVLTGRSAVDASAITGESVHDDVGPGSPVFAGSIALDGMLKIQVRGAGADTVLGRVVKLLADVERASVPILRLFEQRAGVWLPLVLTLAATTLFFTKDLSRAITILVVATPTALVVAGPAAMVAAMSVATRLRVLVKSSDFFERASDVDTLILDKTGTVTLGAPTVTELRPMVGVSDDELLATAVACAFGSLHPVSRAVVAAGHVRGIVARPTELQERPGLGVVATVDGEPCTLGRRALLAECGVEVAAGIDDDVSSVLVARAGRYLGQIALRDRPRDDAHEALAAMRALGIDRFVLLTGDRAAAAREVGAALGVDEVIAEVLPAQKLDVIRAHQKEGRVVMMVGDGVNDAPALAGADVGIAVGAELNEVALGGADAALLGADLARLPRLIRLADTTRRILGQNVWLAFGLSLVLIGFAAWGALDPVTGALAQSVAVIAVVVNSARILRFGDETSVAVGPKAGAPADGLPAASPESAPHERMVRPKLDLT